MRHRWRVTTAESDRLIAILDELYFVRMDVQLASQRLGLAVNEVESAHQYDLMHGREVFLARQDRRRRGVVRPLRPLVE